MEWGRGGRGSERRSSSTMAEQCSLFTRKQTQDSTRQRPPSISSTPSIQSFTIQLGPSDRSATQHLQHQAQVERQNHITNAQRTTNPPPPPPFFFFLPPTTDFGTKRERYCFPSSKCRLEDVRNSIRAERTRFVNRSRHFSSTSSALRSRQTAVKAGVRYGQTAEFC